MDIKIWPKTKIQSRDCKKCDKCNTQTSKMNHFAELGTTTTTITTVTETKVNLGLRWDPSYIKTIPGMLKIGQVIIDSIVFICVMCSICVTYDTQWVMEPVLVKKLFYFLKMIRMAWKHLRKCQSRISWWNSDQNHEKNGTTNFTPQRYKWCLHYCNMLNLISSVV